MHLCGYASTSYGRETLHHIMVSTSKTLTCQAFRESHSPQLEEVGRLGSLCSSDPLFQRLGNSLGSRWPRAKMNQFGRSPAVRTLMLYMKTT
jgi:hypothetical protein